ncbi:MULTISPECIES: FHA domain-containing protein [Actinotignum]|uniref:FHA domain-containing protein n=8 Tax=Actinotignum timonense TaxID=1870995 RepID=A0ABU5GDX9_9ACTO|nr:MULTISPECIES: FHA domain-containing protein [Actinotignum]MBS5748367.1 FHA domain-containing protein [Actinotignum schaalii]MDE1535979.1 FHA domain-containing protein [Actinotignum schaalii]MDE1559000.1 FHA domain-containing protein [Actinotignum schaalii]MDE1664026.1 FHA domain-containing protein [Actinotignum schaalii]MDK6373016.1 FHA domain-containing protein [Actinotignum timonense]
MPSYSYPGDGLLACVPGMAVFTPALPADPAAVWEAMRAGHDFPTLLTHLWSALGADFALFYADGPLLRVAAHGLIVRDVTGRAVADGSNALTWQEAATTQDTTVTVGNVGAAGAVGAESAAFGGNDGAAWGTGTPGNDGAAPAPGPALPLERGMARAGGARISLSPVLSGRPAAAVGRPAAPALAVSAEQPVAPAALPVDRPEASAAHPAVPEPPAPALPPAAPLPPVAPAAPVAESAPVPSYAAATEAYPVQATEPYPSSGIPAPLPAVELRFSFGETVVLGGVSPALKNIIMGRRPLLDAAAARSDPAATQLLPVPSPRQEISRTHCEVLVEAGGAFLRDCHSNNGTYLKHGDGPLRRIEPDHAVGLEDGDLVDMGDGASFTVHYRS